MGIGLGGGDFEWVFFDAFPSWQYITSYISLEYRYRQFSNQLPIPPMAINLGVIAGDGIIVLVPFSIALSAAIGYDFDELYLKGGIGSDLYLLSFGFEGYVYLSKFNNIPNYMNQSVSFYVRFIIPPTY